MCTFHFVAFVCEYSKGPALDWDTFISTINKKISSVKRAMNNSSGSASKSSTKKKQVIHSILYYSLHLFWDSLELLYFTPYYCSP